MICKKCGNDFEPSKGLMNYCSMGCRNSRERSDEVKRRISQSVKNGLASGKIPSYQDIVNRMTDAEKSVFFENRKNAQKKRKNSIRKKNRREWICPVCQTGIMLAPREFSKRKYCSTTCRNISLNPSQRGIRSKAEIQAELRFIQEGLNFTTNDRKILPSGKELDFFFPDKKMAIEWNGIYHYKDVNGKLEKIQKSDLAKKSECESLGIKLIVVKDMTSHRKFISKTIDDLLEILK